MYLTIGLQIIGFAALTLALYILFTENWVRHIEGTINYIKSFDTSLKKEIDDVHKGKNKLFLFFRQAEFALKIQGKEKQFSLVILIAIIASIIGIVIGAIINNIFLSLVLGVGFFTLPFWWVTYSLYVYKMQLNDILYRSLWNITTAYQRSGNINKAIKDNLQYLQSPIKEVFQGYLSDNKYITANTEMALESLKVKIPDDIIFSKWVDNVIRTQRDKKLIPILYSNIGRYQDIKNFNEDNKSEQYEPLISVFAISLLILSIPVLFYFLNIEWFNALMFTIQGKIVIAINAVAILLAIRKAIHILKPLEFGGNE